MATNPYLALDLADKAKTVSQGVAGDTLVIEVQTYLRIMGFPIGNFGPNHNGIDGKLGEATQAALQAFLTLNGFPEADSPEIQTVSEIEQAAVNGSAFRSIAEHAFKQGIQLSISNHSTLAQFVNAIYYYAANDELTSKVPAAVTVAQAILESNYGKSVPVDINTGIYSYNLFGIKGSGTAGSVVSWTHEQTSSGVLQPVRARFRAYRNYYESIEDHSRFFYDNIKRYGAAFQTKTPADFAKSIAKAGYATDSRYAQKLINLMNLWGVS